MSWCLSGCLWPNPTRKKNVTQKTYIYILSFAIIHMYQHLVICKPHSEEQRISPGSLATSPALLQKAMSNPQQCHQRTMPQVEQPKKKWHEVSKGAISWFKVTTFRLYLFHNKSGWDGRWFELTLLCKVSSNRFAAQQKANAIIWNLSKKEPLVWELGMQYVYIQRYCQNIPTAYNHGNFRCVCASVGLGEICTSAQKVFGERPREWIFMWYIYLQKQINYMYISYISYI